MEFRFPSQGPARSVGLRVRSGILGPLLSHTVRVHVATLRNYILEVKVTKSTCMGTTIMPIFIYYIGIWTRSKDSIRVEGFWVSVPGHRCIVRGSSNTVVLV